MVELRDFKLDDKNRLISCLNDAAVTQFLSTKIPSPYTKEDAHWWVTEGSKVDVVRAIAFDEQLVGCIAVNRGEFEYSRSGEIGYWIAQDYWRKGIAYNAIVEITEFVFSNTDIVRIYASVFSENIPSMKLLLKSGYKEEAILKKAMFKNNQFYDSHIFTKLKRG